LICQVKIYYPAIVRYDMNKRTNLFLPTIFFIMASLLCSTTNTSYKTLPLTYAQTNAAALASATMATNNSGATSNDNTSNTAATTNDGLEIKKDIKIL
jgi:hypothetical protein